MSIQKLEKPNGSFEGLPCEIQQKIIEEVFASSFRHSSFPLLTPQSVKNIFKKVLPLLHINRTTRSLLFQGFVPYNHVLDKLVLEHAIAPYRAATKEAVASLKKADTLLGGSLSYHLPFYEVLKGETHFHNIPPHTEILTLVAPVKEVVDLSSLLSLKKLVIKELPKKTTVCLDPKVKIDLELKKSDLAKLEVGENVESLKILSADITELSLQNFPHVKTLHIENCLFLEKIQDLPPSLRRLSLIGLPSLTYVDLLPEGVEKLHLRCGLSIDFTSILPPKLKVLSLALLFSEKLHLSDQTELQEVFLEGLEKLTTVELPQTVTALEAFGCKNLVELSGGSQLTKRVIENCPKLRKDFHN